MCFTYDNGFFQRKKLKVLPKRFQHLDCVRFLSQWGIEEQLSEMKSFSSILQTSTNFTSFIYSWLTFNPNTRFYCIGSRFSSIQRLSEHYDRITCSQKRFLVVECLNCFQCEISGCLQNWLKTFHFRKLFFNSSHPKKKQTRKCISKTFKNPFHNEDFKLDYVTSGKTPW